MLDGLSKIYGPYKRKSDGRWIIIVDGITISYPRYLYEKHHKCTISDDYDVDHIDENHDNNDISNLQLLTKIENVKKTARIIISQPLGPMPEERKEKYRGANNGQAKFTVEQIVEIRKNKFPPPWRVRELCVEYKCTRKTIENILNNKSYK